MGEKKRMSQVMSKRDGEEMKHERSIMVLSGGTMTLTAKLEIRERCIRFKYMHTRFGSRKQVVEIIN
ncbi:hypothetical protein YC2023_041289 [Brassica napus]